MVLPISSICNTWPPTPAILGGTLVGGYPKGEIGQDGITATREVIIPWDKLDEALELLQPPSTFVGGSQTINYGAQYPGRPFLRVVNISWGPLSDKPTELDFNGDYKYEHAKLLVKYGFLRNQQTGSPTSPDPQDPVPLMIHRQSGGVQIVKTDHQGLVWDNLQAKNTKGGAFTPLKPKMPLSSEFSPVRQIIGRKAAQLDMKQSPDEYVVTIEHEITRQRVPRPPFSALRRCAGKCNDREVVFKTGKIPTECLFLWGWNLQATIMANGESSWEMSLRFGERQVIAEDQLAPGGWNHFYRTLGVQKIKPEVVGIGGAVPTSDMVKVVYLGRRGFYRLEKSYGKDEKLYGSPPVLDADGDTISPNPPLTGFEGTDLKIGYNEETALIKQRDFRDLWKPEPIPIATGP